MLLSDGSDGGNTPVDDVTLPCLLSAINIRALYVPRYRTSKIMDKNDKLLYGREKAFSQTSKLTISIK